MVGMNYKDKPENARRFLARSATPSRPSAPIRAGRAAIDWGVYGVPETFIVGPDGTIRHKHVGPLTPEAMPGFREALAVRARVRDAEPSFYEEAPGGLPEIVAEPKPPSAFARLRSRLRSRRKSPPARFCAASAAPTGSATRPPSRFIREAERRAQRRAGLARLLVAALLYAVLEGARYAHPRPRTPSPYARSRRRGRSSASSPCSASRSTSSRGRGSPRAPSPSRRRSPTPPLILGGLLYNRVSTDVPGGFLFAFPLAWAIPLALAANAVYYRPGVQVFATGLYVVGLSPSRSLPAVAPPDADALTPPDAPSAACRRTGFG